jgi:hypothetical protein
VLLPIIFYNLVQHLVAGTVDRLMFNRPSNVISSFSSISQASHVSSEGEFLLQKAP